ncbi:hypothetical protein BHM03_00044585, partial [Ensete ventricosum]
SASPSPPTTTSRRRCPLPQPPLPPSATSVSILLYNTPLPSSTSLVVSTTTGQTSITHSKHRRRCLPYRISTLLPLPAIVAFLLLNRSRNRTLSLQPPPSSPTTTAATDRQPPPSLPQQPPSPLPLFPAAAVCPQPQSTAGHTCQPLAAASFSSQSLLHHSLDLLCLFFPLSHLLLPPANPLLLPCRRCYPLLQPALFTAALFLHCCWPPPFEAPTAAPLPCYSPPVGTVQERAPDSLRIIGVQKH